MCGNDHVAPRCMPRCEAFTWTGPPAVTASAASCEVFSDVAPAARHPSFGQEAQRTLLATREVGAVSGPRDCFGCPSAGEQRHVFMTAARAMVGAVICGDGEQEAGEQVLALAPTPCPLPAPLRLSPHQSSCKESGDVDDCDRDGGVVRRRQYGGG